MHKIIEVIEERGILDRGEWEYGSEPNIGVTLEEFDSFVNLIFPEHDGKYLRRTGIFETYEVPFEQEGKIYYLIVMYGQGRADIITTDAEHKIWQERVMELEKEALMNPLFFLCAYEKGFEGVQVKEVEVGTINQDEIRQTFQLVPNSYVGDCLIIKPEHIAWLQKYLPDEEIDCDKYDYFLEISENGPDVYDCLDLTDTIVRTQLSQGTPIDQLITSTAEELGEFCQAVAVEEGRKQKLLDEHSTSEAVDLIICGLALYFARGGRPQCLAKRMMTKLTKWEEKIKSK